ncbi:MAG: hypothetical protein ACIAS6_14555 [Phycisphaerales bacterium JB060]
MPRTAPTPTTPITTTITLAALTITLAPAAALAQPEVPDGFTIRRIAPLLDGVRPQLSAIDDAGGFGIGVVTSVVRDGLVTVRLIEPSGRIVVIAVFGEPGPNAAVRRIRFDESGELGGGLFATLDNLPGDGSGKTVIVSIDVDGGVEELYRSASFAEGETYDFEISIISSMGVEPGLTLLDYNSFNGTRLSTFGPDFQLTVTNPNSLPPGRPDTDVEGMRRDTSGRYGGGILLADSNDADRFTALWELRDVDGGGVYRRIGSSTTWSVRRYGDLDLAAGGPLGETAYVTNLTTDVVEAVDPDGTHTTWATGFTGIDALSISPDGESMYVADQSGVWLIRASGSEPGPVVLATDPSTPTGSTLSGAPVTSLRVIFNEPVDFVDADVTITNNAGDPVAFDASGSGSQFMLIGLGEPLDGDAYTVTISEEVTSVTTGEALDGDRDGVAGGDAELIFTHACQADFDGDGSLTLFDFLAFQNAFDAGCP